MNWTKAIDEDTRSTIREYNNAIDSNYQHYDFVTLFDAAAIAAKLSNPLRPSAGLILKEPILFIRSREKISHKVNFWLDYIIRNLNKGLQDKLRQQLEGYAKFGYCTGAILSEVLTLLSIQIASGTAIDSFEIFVDAIWTEVKCHVKVTERRKSSKFTD